MNTARTEPLTPHYAVGTDWVAIHIFYSSNANPLLIECVAPLVATLKERGLIRRWFFIRYWQEGPHVRLRLLPHRPQDAAEIRAIAEDAIDAFLQRRPALFQVERSRVDDYHKDMFVFEYGEQEWERQYGDRGMPLRNNNSYDYFEYSPEYDRYGGPAGVDLAEWHFQHSSELVLRLLDSTNVHVRTVMFGLSSQLCLLTGLTFRPTPAALARFLRYYSEYWTTAYPSPLGDPREQYDKNYAEMADALNVRVGELSRIIMDDRVGTLATFIGTWRGHCAELCRRVVDLRERGRLIFRSQDDPERREPITDPDIALGILLSGYVHMTNNRLGVSVHDEAYLAHVLQRSIVNIYGLSTTDMEGVR
jgi:hypothetical protein